MVLGWLRVYGLRTSGRIGATRYPPPPPLGSVCPAGASELKVRPLEKVWLAEMLLGFSCGSRVACSAEALVIKAHNMLVNSGKKSLYN